MAASRSNWSEKEGKTRCGRMLQQQFSPPWCRICHLSIISIGSPRFWIPCDPELRRRTSVAFKGSRRAAAKVAPECLKGSLRSRAFALPAELVACLSSRRCRRRHGTHRVTPACLPGWFLAGSFLLSCHLFQVCWSAGKTEALWGPVMSK